MLLTKTLRFKVHRATVWKSQRLAWLWSNWGQSGYRMHDNMAHRYPTKHVLNQWSCLGLRENPPSRVARWWLRLPITKGERINLPIRGAQAHEDLLATGVRICNSELIRKGHVFFIHLTIQMEVSPPLMPLGRVLAVDLGERVIGTSVTFDGNRWHDPGFHARAVRGIRRHYAWLRRRLQERGHFRTMARIGFAEGRRVEAALHEAAKDIVDRAKSLRAAIAVGDLTGIRRRARGKGRRFASVVNGMPFRRFATLVEYKAAWAGVPVIYVREDRSSQDCHICNEQGRRASQGLFLCRSCGEYNADLNGAANIGNRALRYIREVGASGSRPEGVAPSFSGTAQVGPLRSAQQEPNPLSGTVVWSRRWISRSVSTRPAGSRTSSSS